ncbi:hypothetical protein GZ77_12000 [Endozoicomonas montiporae]|uniref:Uncharacterized protein n=1 Tax=Endozoicomonas montiporae TaxID=1027273 RepID=A0A081N933_9GAMM|nr:hypothetical protein [Endozoicomonas montiporae]KEQ14956.1 hypothetical protein GZ77_12000 [Endozoicomonas montiporae]
MSNDSKYKQDKTPHWHNEQPPPCMGCQHSGHERYADEYMRHAPPPPYFGHPYYQYPHPGMMPPSPYPSEAQSQQKPQQQAASPLTDQAQSMVEGALGEDAGIFLKNCLAPLAWMIESSGKGL